MSVFVPSSRTAAGTSRVRAWGCMPSKEVSPTGVVVDGEAQVVVRLDLHVAAALQPDAEPGRGPCRHHRGQGEGVGLALAEGDAVVPEPEVLRLEQRGEEDGVLLEDAGGVQGRQGLRGRRARAAARRGAEGHALPVGGDAQLEDGVVRVRVAAALGEEEEGGAGTEAVVPGLDVEGKHLALAGEPHRRSGQHEVRGGEVGNARRRGGEQVLPRDGMQALRPGDEAGEQALGAGAAGRARAAADRAAETGLAGDDAVEGDADEHPAGEDEAARARRRGAAGAISR